MKFFKCHVKNGLLASDFYVMVPCATFAMPSFGTGSTCLMSEKGKGLNRQLLTLLAVIVDDPIL